LTGDEPSADARPRIQSAARTVAILLAIARSANGLDVKAISAAAGVPRQTAYHLLHTLAASRIVRRNAQNRYVLGLAAALIAEGFRRQLAPPEHLAPQVRAIAAAIGETAYASGWMDDEIVVLATARGHSPIQAAEVPHGYAEDAHARASGKLLLALADPAVAAAYLERRPMTPRTPQTITSPDRLMAEFEQIRRQGYAVEEEEFSAGLCCLAVPLQGLNGGVVFGISVPSVRFRANFERYLSELRDAALHEVG
jgi:IclR family transcriptional regulator, acetate operon repressor